MTKPTRLRCQACSQIFPESALLTAHNPFDPPETIYGCPNCKQCDEGFVLLCDHPGCERDATCGTPAHSGYRQTCGEHCP